MEDYVRFLLLRSRHSTNNNTRFEDNRPVVRFGNSRGSISYSLSLEDLSSSPVFLGNKFDRRDPPGRFVPVSARYHEEEEGWWRA